MVSVDLDELNSGQVFGPIFSDRSWRPYRFHRPDLHRPEVSSLKEAVITTVCEKTSLEQQDLKRVVVLTQPRTLGHCFNPVSFYYVYDGEENLKAVMAEINNTPWDQRFCYVLETKGISDKHEFEKNFHVSPFMPMDQKYLWKFNVPDDRIVVEMENHDPKEGHLFDAGMAMEREELSSVNLIKALFLFPFNTLKTLAAIYWHALRLRLKGATYFPPPSTEVSHA